jgi:HD-GYP domain-containing protein (c-di-GMP phosphodiesterase class II)
MPTFQQKTARRIAMVSLTLATIVSPLAWYIERESAEEGTVALATEESQRLLEQHATAFLADVDSPQAHAQRAARAITGGLFDIAEIYNREGRKLAEAMTPRGALIESQVPSHGRPTYNTSFYESLHLPSGQWALRIFVPVRLPLHDLSAPVTGYFEGVRIVPDWQQEQMRSGALTVAVLVAIAALLCGAVIYPVVVHLARDNERKAQDLLRANISMMEALGRAIAKRDSDTGAHNYRVAWIATCIAEQLGLESHEMQALITGSFLHDVGKIGIPDAILLKPGKLTEAEFDIMRTHVEQGEEIVSGIGALEHANAVVSGHHEKWNGSGYPKRLQGEHIPISARIFAVADVFDALCSKRPYKEPMPFDNVMAILEKDTGSHFDPRVMEAFRPMARPVFNRLVHCSEQDCRALLETKLYEHFQLAR